MDEGEVYHYWQNLKKKKGGGRRGRRHNCDVNLVLVSRPSCSIPGTVFNLHDSSELTAAAISVSSRRKKCKYYSVKKWRTKKKKKAKVVVYRHLAPDWLS